MDKKEKEMTLEKMRQMYDNLKYIDGDAFLRNERNFRWNGMPSPDWINRCDQDIHMAWEHSEYPTAGPLLAQIFRDIKEIKEWMNQQKRKG